ncbi:uncharacterized protein DSM5745_08251 [Aspergillus mulundensis]|uniref:Myb-like DNA-binding domain-containing protein n=1 Tax=Aspergillus mulundensis TaxID=1810919 RepID=A0A3D8R9V8_9EURO|nr:hypothetical protein DSM5745_08251 [Aspergillus mulundensis]RDW70740.1 hypothetical protein DSM5745_08251 [Aspergillus mulundensis]
MSPIKESLSSSAKESASAPTVVRRSKTMPIDSPTAKFLYTIIKQLDLKGIDWSLVASQLDISNGHAARMRYHRFRNQMEGYQPQQRKRAANANTNKSSSKTAASCKSGLQKAMRSPSPTLMPAIKPEPSEEKHNVCDQKIPPYIKTEQESSSSGYAHIPIPRLADIPQYYPPTPHSSAYLPSMAARYHYSMSLAPEPRISPPAYTATPAYPPVPAYETGYRSSVAWGPIKNEPKDMSEEKKDLDMGDVQVKEEVVDESKPRKE